MGGMFILAALGLGALLFLGSDDKEKEPAPPGTPTAVFSLNDDEFLGWLESPGKKLVEYCDSTNPTCVSQSNYTNAFAKNNPNIKVVRMYEENAPAAFVGGDINQTPTLIALDGYTEIRRATGVQTEAQLKALVG